MQQVQFVSTVYAEEEVEYGLRKMTDSVRDTLAAMRSSPNFVLWRTPFYDVKVVVVVLIGFFLFVFEVLVGDSLSYY